ncbi:MAG: hypothetical protein H7Y42_16180 [Chitinophagaceae bacterium]|nr:hypothetical protein [Chitinophagaceae bacterium]
MKKAAILAGAAFFLLSAAANAQTDSLPSQPVKTKTDQWNNHSPEKYKLQPMPEALNREKVFPVIGKYNVTDKDGVTTPVSIAIDETNKGIVWIEGLPQGKIKAQLRKSPGIYKIPVQKSADDKDVSEGVLVFDRDNNTLDVCIGCTYNIEDPTAAFTAAQPEVAVTEVKAKKGVVKTKTKMKPVKTWKYSGTKFVETTEVTVHMGQ